MIINPGSNTLGDTYENARKEAERLLANMLEEGITDIELLEEYRTDEQGRFTFTYRHRVTGKTGEWDITGLEWDNEWEKRGFMFPPRMYWNGSSVGNPEWKDFLTDEYELKVSKKNGL